MLNFSTIWLVGRWWRIAGIESIPVSPRCSQRYAGASDILCIRLNNYKYVRLRYAYFVILLLDQGVYHTKGNTDIPIADWKPPDGVETWEDDSTQQDCRLCFVCLFSLLHFTLLFIIYLLLFLSFLSSSFTSLLLLFLLHLFYCSSSSFTPPPSFLPLCLQWLTFFFTLLLSPNRCEGSH